jgi:hypothetical protein
VRRIFSLPELVCLCSHTATVGMYVTMDGHERSYLVRCDECGAATEPYDTVEEAKQDWKDGNRS